MIESNENEISFAFERLSLASDSNDNKSKHSLTNNVLEAIDVIRHKKKKRPDFKSIYELIKRNENANISESEIKNLIDEMINKKLVYNKKTDNGLDPLYKNIEKDDETPLDCSYLSESKNSNTFQEEPFCNLSQILTQPPIPIAKDLETPTEKGEVVTKDNVVNEKITLKFEAKISAIKNYIDCEFSEINKKLNLFSESMNKLSKTFEIHKTNHTSILGEDIEFLKNELKSKGEMIKSLIETQTLVLETVKNSKTNPTTVQNTTEQKWKTSEQNLNNHNTIKKKTLFVKNISSNVALDDITELFGLNLTKYLRENCNIDLPINLQRNCHKGYAYITVPDHVAVELVKLNDLELKGQNLVIEEAVAMPKSFNSNLNKFNSPNRFAALTPNQQENKCDFEIADASNREFHFESAGNGRNRQTKSNRQKVVNSPKRRSQVFVNKHPENQTAFGKLIARPENDVTNPSKENDVVNLGKETDNILIFSDSIPGKIKMYEFNKVLKMEMLNTYFFQAQLHNNCYNIWT